MCTILLSINPDHVENIMQGKKIYEFRKTLCKRKVDKIVIYSTSPVMKVIGEAEVEDVLVGEPGYVWNITRKKSGIKKDFFDDYYKDKSQAIAYKLCNIIRYEEPKRLIDLGIKCAPQSFQYIENF